MEKRNDWKGLWQKEGKEYIVSKTFTIDELKKELNGKDKFKILVVKNKYYEEGSNKPIMQFVFSTMIDKEEKPDPYKNDNLSWF